jgi:OHCU decarboxylase
MARSFEFEGQRSVKLEPRHDLQWLNLLPKPEARAEFLKCCGCTTWAQQMVTSRPFESSDELTAKAAAIWWSLTPGDWLEAFRSHPKIGGAKAAKEVSAQSQAWSGQEQAGVQNAAKHVADALDKLNRDYEAKFGYIFIVCATGKSSQEMLAILVERLKNDSKEELPIAAGQQAKITELRLRKLVR